MTSKSKAKGTYHENYFVKLFKEWGLKVKRQPLSGALGGEYSGDLVIELGERVILRRLSIARRKDSPPPSQS